MRSEEAPHLKAVDGGGTTAEGGHGSEYASRLEPLDEALEALLLLLIESSFVLTDPRGVVTRWGDRAKLLFGWETSKIAGRSVFETVLGDDNAEMSVPLQAWRNFLESREGEVPPARFSVQGRHRDGHAFPMELTFIPVRLNEGSEFSFFVRDLTVELGSGPKLARLRREHKKVLGAISTALTYGMSLEPNERLAGTLIAFHPTGATPWVEAAEREAEEAAVALATISQADGVEGETAERLGHALVQARKAEREIQHARSEREAMRSELAKAAAHEKELQSGVAELREQLHAARREAAEAGERAAVAQAAAEAAGGKTGEALRGVEELRRESETIRDRLEQAAPAADVGAQLDAVKRLVQTDHERVERLDDLERRLESERERLARLEEAAGAERGRFQALERASQELRIVVSALQKGGSQVSAEVERSKRESDRIRTWLESAQRERDGERSEVRAVREELATALDKLDRASREVATSAAAAAADGEASAAASAPTGEELRRLEQLRREVAEANDRVESLRRESETRLESLSRRVDEARDAASAATGENSDTSKQLDDLRVGTKTAISELEQMRRVSKEARAEVERARADAAKARHEAEQAKAEVERTRTSLREAESALESARAAAQSAGADAQAGRRAGEQARDAAAKGGEEAGRALHAAQQARTESQQALAAAERARAEAQEALRELQGLRAGVDDTAARVGEVRAQADAASQQLAATRGYAPSPALSSAPSWERVQSLQREEPEEKTDPAREPREGFDDAADPMAVLALDGRFRELNPRFAELIGYSEREFSTAKWPSSLSDEETRDAHRKLLQALSAGELEESEIETCYLHKEGLLVPVAGRITVVKGEDGSPLELLLVGDNDGA